MPSKQLKGHLLAWLTIAIWGTTFVSTKILLRSFAPVEILFIRFAIGTLALMVVYPKTLPWRGLKEEKLFMLAGLSGITLYYLLENVALTFSLASSIGVILSCTPFFTAITTWLFDREKPTGQFLIGFLCAIGGILLITYSTTTQFSLNPLGNLLAVAAGFVWALYSVMIKRLGDLQLPVIQTTRRTFMYGMLFMIPTLPLFHVTLDVNRIFASANLFNVLYLGLGASALCFVTWNGAVKILGVVKTSVYIYLVPVITVIFSVLLLHEQLTLLLVIGMVMTAGGVFLSEHRLPQVSLNLQDEKE